MSKPLVLVTGASGFVASHVVRALLEEGYQVKATVRNAKDENKVKHLKELSVCTGISVEIVDADLTDADCWDRAVDGCSYVMHVASPCPLASPKDPDLIIKPAVDGTLNVLRACAKAGTVKRVVLTSSTATMANGYREHSYTEEDWIDENSPDVTVYPKSKTMAERAAWKFVEELPENSRFELAVVNPILVLGPVLHRTPGSSTGIIKMLLERETPMLPKYALGVVDVRDVALAHVRCMTTPEAAGHRHLLYSETLWITEAAAILDKEFRPLGYNVPTRTIPSFLLDLGCLFSKDMKSGKRMCSKPMKFDATRMRDVLGIQPRDVSTTVTDMAYSLIDNGFIKKTDKYRGRTESTIV